MLHRIEGDILYVFFIRAGEQSILQTLSPPVYFHNLENIRLISAQFNKLAAALSWIVRLSALVMMKL